MSSSTIYDSYYTTCFGLSGLPDVDATASAYEALYGAWINPLPLDSKILDIGAGLGVLLVWLQRKGFSDLQGIDISPEQSQIARSVYGCDVQCIGNTLEYLEGFKDYFDAIFMTDVIEHIPKLQTLDYLRAILRALKPGGVLILRTENMSSPIGAYQYRMDFTHEYCYTEKSLSQVLRAAGFRDIQIKGEPYRIGKNPRALKRALIRTLWWFVLGQLYDAERPVGNNPTIFSKNLLARAARPPL